jgi:hypothetical protein
VKECRKLTKEKVLKPGEAYKNKKGWIEILPRLKSNIL